jgi:signal transduction histidine kinase
MHQGLSLRVRTVLLVIVALVVLLTGLYFISRFVVLQSFTRLEEKSVSDNSTRAVNAMTEDIASLDRASHDYAYWDDTYAFMEDGNPEYVKDNLTDDTFNNFQLNLMMLVDTQGKVIFARGFDLVAKDEAPVPPEMLQPGQLARLGQFPALDSSITGIIMLPEGPLCLSSRPILTSALSGPSHGSFIMARWLNQARVTSLADVTHLTLDVYPIDSTKLPEPVRSVFKTSPSTAIVVRPLDAQKTAGYAVITDLNSQPILILQTTMARDIYQQGQQSISVLLGFMLALGFVFCLVVALLLEYVILARIARLNADVAAIGGSIETAAYVRVSGKDELSNLGKAMNTMLDRLKLGQTEMIAMRNQAVEALRFKSQFLANVSHDLRTPLNAIMGYSAMLREGKLGVMSSRQVEAVAHISQDAQLLLEQIDELLDYSRLDVGKLTLNNANFSPEKLMDSVYAIAEPLAQTKELRFNHHITTNLPDQLSGDFDRLRLIVMNLVNNAIQFTKQGEVNLRFYMPDGDHWAMEVADTGPGIPFEVQKYIYEPFQQVDTNQTPQGHGVGLGLTIVKQLTELMGGQVQIVSELNHGSTFTVVLPLSNPI